MKLYKLLVIMEHYRPIIFITILVLLSIGVVKHIQYKRGAYYQITRLSYFSIWNDKGRYGEYLIYKSLKKLESEGAKFLFNLYIQKGNGNTTEIDVLMISPKGIFVFESKNYSGWIFGNESQKSWCQTLSLGWGRSKKEHFFNPIMQNQTHIEALKGVIGAQIPVYSVIVFSDRCTLKNVTVQSPNVCVINRDKVVSVVSSVYGQTWYDSLDKDDIVEIYNKLYPFSQVDEATKAQHISKLHHSNEKRYNQHFQSNEGKQSSVLQKMRCPWCNGELTLRSAKKGMNIGHPFYGCSNYPYCTYTRNIEDDLKDEFFD